MGKGGYLRIEGESVEREEDKVDGNKVQEDVYDGAGNKIDVKQNATLSAKDAKKPIKDIEKKLKDGKKKKTLTDEEMWELEDKLNELKEQIVAACTLFSMFFQVLLKFQQALFFTRTCATRISLGYV